MTSQTGGVYAYHRGREIANDPTITFHSLVHAALLVADESQLEMLRYAFPEIWEAKIKYQASGSKSLTVEQLLGLPDK